MERPRPFKIRPATLLLLLAAAIAAMYMLRQCSHRTPGIWDGTPRPSQGDTIDVAIEYSPMSLYRYADTLGGFSYDMIRHIAGENGLTLKFHPLTALSDGLRGLNTGLYDIVVADLPSTASYGNEYRFTEPVFLDRQILVQKLDSASAPPSVGTQLDLAGRTVYVTYGSPAAARLANLAREIGDTIIVCQSDEYSAEQLFLLTASGNLPLSVVNEKVARRLAKSYPLAHISTGISFTQFQSWVVTARDTLLAAKLDSLILKTKGTPFYDGLLQRYNLDSM